MKIVAKYKHPDEKNDAELGKLEDGTWMGFNDRDGKDEVTVDGWQRSTWERRWPLAFKGIDDGTLKPYWTADGTGVQTAEVVSSAPGRNNDGRSTCFSCSADTKTVAGFLNSYQVCVKCGL